MIVIHFPCEQDWSSSSSTFETITTQSTRERERGRAASHSVGATEVAETQTKHHRHHASFEDPVCPPSERGLLVAGENHSWPATRHSHGYCGSPSPYSRHDDWHGYEAGPFSPGGLQLRQCSLALAEGLSQAPQQLLMPSPSFKATLSLWLVRRRI